MVSLEIVVGYKKVRSFQGTKVNLSVLLEKPDITYRGALNREFLELSCRISPRPMIMLKILYFSEDHHFFQISLWIKSLYDRVENLFIYFPVRQNLGPGRQFQQTYQPGKPTGRISSEHLDGVWVGLVSTWVKTFQLLKTGWKVENPMGKYLFQFCSSERLFCWFFKKNI